MFAKILFVALFAAYEVSAQTAAQVNCGQVDIPQQTPAQIWNPWTWGYPGWIAASNCYTGYLQGSYQALTDLYSQLYTAGPPTAGTGGVTQPNTGNQQQGGQTGGQQQGGQTGTQQGGQTGTQGGQTGTQGGQTGTQGGQTGTQQGGQTGTQQGGQTGTQQGGQTGTQQGGQTGTQQGGQTNP